MTFSFATLIRSSKPNNYLLAPDGFCQQSTPDGHAPVFSCSEEELFNRLLSMMEQDGQYRDIEADLGSLTLSAVAVTKILRFKDDIDISVLEAEGGATLAVYSCSRVGHSDLGKNKARIDALLNEIAD